MAACIRRQAVQIREQAEWTGEAADAYTSFTSGLSRSVSALEPPLAQAAAPLRDFAAALRTAQQRVDACAAVYQKLYPLTTGNRPAGTNIPMADIELADSYNQAEAAITAYDEQANVTSKALGQVTAEMTREFFGSEGPFRNFLERSHLPWDAVAGDALIENFIKGGEEAEEAEEAEKALEGREYLWPTIDKVQEDVVTPVLDEIETGNADAQTNLTLLQTLEDCQVKRGETIAQVMKALEETNPELAKSLSGLKTVGAEMDVIGFVAGIYALASPPQGDTGAWRAADRVAGFGVTAGSAAGIAENAFNVDFSELSLGPFESLDARPLR